MVVDKRVVDHLWDIYLKWPWTLDLIIKAIENDCAQSALWRKFIGIRTFDLGHIWPIFKLNLCLQDILWSFPKVILSYGEYSMVVYDDEAGTYDTKALLAPRWKYGQEHGWINHILARLPGKYLIAHHFNTIPEWPTYSCLSNECKDTSQPWNKCHRKWFSRYSKSRRNKAKEYRTVLMVKPAFDSHQRDNNFRETRSIRLKIWKFAISLKKGPVLFCAIFMALHH